MKATLRKASVLLAVALLYGMNIQAQTRADAVKLYNEGVKAVQTNIDSAIIKFESVVKMSEAIGETANDLKQNAAQTLPGLYLKSASAKLSAKKPGAEVVAAARQAAAAATKYNNAAVKENAGKLLVQAYNKMATDFFVAKDYPKALATFDSVLAINPDNLSAMFNKATIYKAQNNAEAFEQTIDSYVAKAGTADPAKAKQASQSALEYFRAAGSKANQENKLDEALNLLNKGAKYGEDKDLFYYFADVYNKQKNFDKGIEFAQKGLALETGAAEAKAKFYYQLAVAQAGKGQTAEACASFKNAVYGAFAEASKAQMKNLKCQ
jgi:tetratricopeptide (TPR) repeat protein